MSERRTDRFLDRARNQGLPPFLAHEVGVDSGPMIAQYTAAGIVSEAEAPRGAGLGRLDPVVGHAGGPRLDGLGGGARKLRRGIDGLPRVLAIEVADGRARARLRGRWSPAGPPARCRVRRVDGAPARTASSPPRSRRSPTGSRGEVVRRAAAVVALG